MLGQQGGWGSVGGGAACVVAEGLGSMRGASKVQCSLKQPNCNPNFNLTCSPMVLSVTTLALSRRQQFGLTFGLWP